MFEQHPVPQNISSYQFHLVGDMTLKQFMEIAGGVVVAVVIYVLGLPGIIKWPLCLISVGMGAALAFLPLEERPLEKWIFAFFRSVYSPTLFHWEKRPGTEIKYFADEGAQVAAVGAAGTTNLSKLDQSENSFLSKVSTILKMPNTAIVSQPIAAATQTSEVKVPTTQVVQQPVNNNQGQVTEIKVTAPTFQAAQAVPLVAPQLNRAIDVPQAPPLSVGRSTDPQVVVEEQPADAPSTATNPISSFTPKQVGQAQQAVFSNEASPPSVPTIPDTVSGQVMDADKKIVEGAILEIIDSTGRAVRALKTNRVGHFLIVTPLAKGTYTIITEKEGYKFEPIKFETTGTIIQPIAIMAKANDEVTAQTAAAPAIV